MWWNQIQGLIEIMNRSLFYVTSGLPYRSLGQLPLNSLLGLVGLWKGFFPLDQEPQKRCNYSTTSPRKSKWPQQKGQLHHDWSKRTTGIYVPNILLFTIKIYHSCHVGKYTKSSHGSIMTLGFLKKCAGIFYVDFLGRQRFFHLLCKSEIRPNAWRIIPDGFSG